MRIHPESEYVRKVQAERKAARKKIIVCVEGGVVQGVYAEDESVDVTVIDVDELKEHQDLGRDLRDAYVEEQIGLFNEIGFDFNPDSQEAVA